MTSASSLLTILRAHKAFFCPSFQASLAAPPRSTHTVRPPPPACALGLVTPPAGAGHVDDHHVRTGCALYLNIKHTRIEKPKAELSVSKATTLAIGTPDGFDVSDNADFTIEKTHTLVCKPAGESLKLSDPNIPATLLSLLNALIDHMSASVSAVSARRALPLFPFMSGLAALCAY